MSSNASRHLPRHTLLEHAASHRRNELWKDALRRELRRSGAHRRRRGWDIDTAPRSVVFTMLVVVTAAAVLGLIAGLGMCR